MAKKRSHRNYELFELLYRQHGRLMLNIAYSLLRDRSRAEDAVHDAFVRVWRHIDSIAKKSDEHRKALLLVITRQCAITSMRETTQHHPAIPAGDGSEPIFTAAVTIDRYDHLLGILADVPQDDKVLLQLAYVCGYTSSELAKMLGIREDNMRKKLQRIRDRIVRQFNREEDEDAN